MPPTCVQSEPKPQMPMTATIGGRSLERFSPVPSRVDEEAIFPIPIRTRKWLFAGS